MRPSRSAHWAIPGQRQQRQHASSRRYGHPAHRRTTDRPGPRL